jgi:hypothetical protein
MIDMQVRDYHASTFDGGRKRQQQQQEPPEQLQPQYPVCSEITECQNYSSFVQRGKKEKGTFF